MCNTVAKNHQFWMCYLLLKDEHLLSPSVDFSPKTRSCAFVSEDPCVQAECQRIIPNLCMEVEIHHPDWVKVQSSVLHEGVFVLLNFDTDTPVFGKICDLLNIDSTVIIYVQKYFGDVFTSHYKLNLQESFLL